MKYQFRSFIDDFYFIDYLFRTLFLSKSVALSNIVLFILLPRNLGNIIFKKDSLFSTAGTSLNKLSKFKSRFGSYNPKTFLFLVWLLLTNTAEFEMLVKLQKTALQFGGM